MTTGYEKTVETYLSDRVRALGGWSLKFTSPGTAGVPDRLVVLPSGLFLVELKAPGEPLRASQKKVFPRIERIGTPVFIADCKADVDRILETIK